MRIFDDLNHSLLFLEVVNFLSTFIDTVCDYLVDVIIVTIVDPCLVQNVVLEVIWPFFWSNSHLDEGKTRDEAEFQEYLVLVNLVPGIERLAVCLELLDQALGFPRAKSRQELKLVLHVLVVNKQVNVNAYSVDCLNVDLFKLIHKPGLVDALLKRVQ